MQSTRATTTDLEWGSCCLIGESESTPYIGLGTKKATPFFIKKQRKLLLAKNKRSAICVPLIFLLTFAALILCRPALSYSYPLPSPAFGRRGWERRGWGRGQRTRAVRGLSFVDPDPHGTPPRSPQGPLGVVCVSVTSTQCNTHQDPFLHLEKKGGEEDIYHRRRRRHSVSDD